MRKQILESIHQLLYNNIYCSDPRSKKWATIAANGYEKRIIGFKAEIEFKRKMLLSSKTDVLDGGYLIPIIPKKRCLDAPIYLTITSNDPSLYRELFETINLLDCHKMFLVHYNMDDFLLWKMVDIMGLGIPILTPNFKVYEFKNNTFTKTENNVFAIKNCFLSSRKKRYKASYPLNYDGIFFIEKILKNYSNEK